MDNHARSCERERFCSLDGEAQAMEQLEGDYWSLGNSGYGQHLNWHLSSRGIPYMFRNSTLYRNSLQRKAPRRKTKPVRFLLRLRGGGRTGLDNIDGIMNTWLDNMVMNVGRGWRGRERSLENAIRLRAAAKTRVQCEEAEREVKCLSEE